MIDPLAACLILLAFLAFGGLSMGPAIIAASTAYLLLKGLDPSIAAESILQGLFNGYTLLAIPLFILAADIMNAGSLADRLLAFCRALVGRLKGGLGHVNVVASLIFSGMSGSAIADAVGMGKIIINMMTKDGKYSASYAAAITAASATIGPIIPPSIPMVLYALVSDQSVGFLFAAGIVPGLLMAAMLMLMNMVMAHRRKFPTDDKIPLRDFPRITFEATPALLLPVILLGGIYGGVMTPTEAASVAAFYALFISVAFYRSVSARQFYSTLVAAARSTATVGILIAGALALKYVITRENLPDIVAAFIGQYDLSVVGFLIVLNLVFLVLGCLIDAGAILLIIVPIFIPTAQALGIDLVHLGVIVVVNAMIGLITPPYGLLLFIVSSISGAPLMQIIRDLLPFLCALLVALGIITFCPDVVLWLPRLLGYQG
ncbi:TRAP transporter large permease [Salipiger sp.]|uniref:TRAP transporter large permease n=1 Tax=Salipiger sp. TaxID=2078585 RepID=UPI003A9740D7